jgi:hypothetical protein
MVVSIQKEKRMKVLTPVGKVRSGREYRIAKRLNTLQNRTIGFLDNTKPNADVFLRRIKELIEKQYEIDSIWRRKHSASNPAHKKLIGELVKECDAVVIAHGDCGSCTAWTIDDGITLEKEGVPTATICSSEFAPLGQYAAQARGMPGLPIPSFPHPSGGLPPEEVRKKAEHTIDEVIYVLTTPAEKLEREYREKYLR